MNLGALGLCAFLSAGVGGSFHETVAHSKSVRPASGSQHWVCSRLSTGITGSFDEAFAALKVCTDGLWLEALVWPALVAWHMCAALFLGTCMQQ